MSESREGKVLVLGEDIRAPLTVIRSLGRAGIEVHLGWCAAEAPTARSKYIARHHDIPAYSPADPAWLEAFQDIMRKERFDLVIPCDDKTLIPLQKRRAELEPFGKIALLDDRAFEVTQNKWLTAELAKKLDIPAPRSILVKNEKEAKDALESFTDFPVILKPLSSFDAAAFTASKRHVQKAYDAGAFEKRLISMLQEGPVQAQEFFTGKGCGVEALAQRGKILTAFQHERVHEPIHGGGSSFRKSAPLSPELYAATEKLMAALNYTGVAMAEFKINEESGNWILVEINGRFWGSLPLAVEAGIDFPLYLYQMLTQGKTDFNRVYRDNLHCRNIVMDLAWMRDNARADHGDKTLMTRPWASVVKELLLIPMGRTRNDAITLDDPVPGIAELAGLLRKLWVKAKIKLRLKSLTLPFVRERASQNAAHKFRRARTILFLCKGNICRSPFAAEQARIKFPEKVFLSAGTYDRSGRFSPDMAIQTARAFETDLSDHRSQPLTDALMKQADLLVIFDANNAETLALSYPGAKGKTLYLGLLDAQNDLIIPDPDGGDAARFTEIYGRISSVLRSL